VKNRVTDIRSAPLTGALDPELPILAGVAAILGGIRVAAAFARHEVFGGVATLALGMMVLGVAGLLLAVRSRLVVRRNDHGSDLPRADARVVRPHRRPGRRVRPPVNGT